MIKKYDFKPLLLIIPFAVLLLVFNVIDAPLPEETSEAESTEAAIVVVEPATQEIAQEISTENNEITQGEVVEGGDSQEEMTQAETTTQPELTEEEKYPSYTPAEVAAQQPIVDTNDYKLLKLVIGTTGDMENYAGDSIYKEADDESEVLGTLQYAAAVELAKDQDEDGWYHVKLYGDSKDGYIRKKSAAQKKIPIGSADKTRDQIVKNAIKYLGLKFVQYGEDLETGIDCSNFIRQIYLLSGIDIPKTPNEQAAAGKDITMNEARPGDIIYYYEANNGYGHVGLYLGNNMIINSSGHSGKKYPKGGVRLCCVTYPDREKYHVINILDNLGTTTNE